MKLGIIGMSEGNGHPYSWSAIFNGYDPAHMQHCGFPVIPQYLAEQHWPQARIAGAAVTRVWTQDQALSRHIASASLIDMAVDELAQLQTDVDAVLLARDDAEHHLGFAEPILRAGLPIYIDKPIAHSLAALDTLYSLERYAGQIFTCSAMRYSPDLQLSEADRQRLGPLREIHAITPKSWDKYAVHIIEPVLNMLDTADTVVQTERSFGASQGSALTARWRSGVITRFVATGVESAAPIAIRVIGAHGWQDKVFQDTFTAFKAALQDFVDGVRTETVRSPVAFNKKVVSLIEAGKAED